MNRKQEIFNAKILLFGEYSIIHGSMALSVPYGHFKGELSFLGEDKYTDYELAVQSNRRLNEYQSSLASQDWVDQVLDIESLRADVSRGLYFESTIPQGYGLGSSGALTAAIFSRYGKENTRHNGRINDESLPELKNLLSRLENFFHGTSSGFDPLSSFLRIPILMEGKDRFFPVSLPRNKHYGSSGIFLLNTGIPRETGTLVDQFMDRCKKDEVFFRRFLSEYIPVNNATIHSILKGDLKDFMRNLAQLSHFQFEAFSNLIPEIVKPFWEEGLTKHGHYLKLCGAGGGGFLLGFSKNLRETLEQTSALGFETVTVYRSDKRDQKSRL